MPFRPIREALLVGAMLVAAATGAYAASARGPALPEIRIAAGQSVPACVTPSLSSTSGNESRASSCIYESGRGSVTVRFTSSTGGVVKGRLARRQGRGFRSFGSLTLSLRRGSNSLTIKRSSSGRLTAGAYRLALSFSDGVSSNLATARTLNFTIRR